MDIRFKNIIPPLSADEYAQLEKNILQDGIRDPLVVWGDTLIDGHNRYSIAQKHGLDYASVSVDFANDKAATEWIILNQFGRRNINNYQRSILALELEDIIAEKAKNNQRQAGGAVPQKSAEAVETRKEVAKIAGVSHDTIDKVKKIKAYATDEVKAKTEAGEISVNQAYQETVREIKAEARKIQVASIIGNAQHDDSFVCGDCLIEMQSIKDGSVACVITDPPYGIDYVSNYRVIDNDVDRNIENDTVEKAISLWDKTCAILYDKMAENSHLYAFTSWKVYPEFKAITEKYFQVKNCLVWVKNNWSMGDLNGNYAEQYEMIIFATKGRRELVGGRDTNILQYDRVASSRLLHSCEKPKDLIEFLIDKSTIQGELVIDPFAGSGSTLKACKSKNRKYWGCELDEYNYKVALGGLNGSV